MPRGLIVLALWIRRASVAFLKESRPFLNFSIGIKSIWLSEWLLVRKCSETTVWMQLPVGLSIGRLCSLKRPLRRRLVSPIYFRLHKTGIGQSKNLMKTGIGQSKYRNLTLFHVVWSVPAKVFLTVTFSMMMKMMMMMMMMMTTTTMMWRYHGIGLYEFSFFYSEQER